MSLLDSVFSRLGSRASASPDGDSSAPTSSEPGTKPADLADASAAQRSRRDLLRIALRDIKGHLGIPTDWLQMHVMGSSSPRRGPGVHACLVVRHWHPLMMLHAPSIEQMLVQRTILIDPQAVDWLMGVMWRFELDPALDLGPLPPSSAWSDPGPAAGTIL